MQTFLPFPSIIQSLQALDKKRLGKQRLEAYQILKILKDGGTGGYSKHPAVKMRQNNIPYLVEYYNESLKAFEAKRGYNIKLKPLPHMEASPEAPWFMGIPEFHDAMKARLLNKDYEYYSKIFSPELVTYNGGQYFWPSPEKYIFLDNHRWLS